MLLLATKKWKYSIAWVILEYYGDLAWKSEGSGREEIKGIKEKVEE